MNSNYYVHLIALVLIPLLVTGCLQESENHDHPALTTGRQLFEHHCSTCHGDTGNGNFFEGIPANRSSTMNKEQLISWLKNSIGEDRPAPSFPKMSDGEAEKIVSYMLTL